MEVTRGVSFRSRPHPILDRRTARKRVKEKSVQQPSEFSHGSSPFEIHHKLEHVKQGDGASFAAFLRKREASNGEQLTLRSLAALWAESTEMPDDFGKALSQDCDVRVRRALAGALANAEHWQESNV
jgi:hypothetical protein